MKVCIPTMGEKGLDNLVGEHFGRVPTYTIVDLETQDDEFEVQDDDGKTKIVKQKVVNIDGIMYRVPNSVLNQLKILLEDNPELKFFKVKKSGQGLNTDYTVIPLIK